MFQRSTSKVVIFSLGFVWFYVLGVNYGWRNEWVGMAAMFVGAIIMGIGAMVVVIIHGVLREIDERIERKIEWRAL